MAPYSSVVSTCSLPHCKAVLVRWLHCKWRHRKTATFNHLIIISSYISHSTTDRHAVPTAIPRFSGLPDSMVSLPTLADVDRYPKCNMATAKPEVVISHVLQQIDTWFQRSTQVLGVAVWTRYTDTRRRPPTLETQDGDRQTGNSYIYAELELIPSNSVGHVGFSYNTRRVRRHQKPGNIAVATTCLSV